MSTRTLQQRAGVSALAVLTAVLCAAASPFSFHPSHSYSVMWYYTSWTEMDGVALGHVDQLMADAMLDDNSLACLNLSQLQSDGVFEGLRTWYEANTSAYTTALQALRDAEAKVRYWEAAIGNGEDRATELASAQTALTTAQSSYNTQVAAARTASISGLTTEQTTLADALTDNSGPMPYRVLELTSAQLQGLEDALETLRQQLAVATSAQQRATARSTFDSAVTTAIGSGNVSTLTSVQAYLGTVAHRVMMSRCEVLHGVTH